MINEVRALDQSIWQPSALSRLGVRRAIGYTRPASHRPVIIREDR